jgi:hypothetical protein
VHRIPGAKPRNIIFILVDDLRYDVFGFTGRPFVETPNIDSLAKNCVHLKNAFVTTSIGSPRRSLRSRVSRSTDEATAEAAGKSAGSARRTVTSEEINN